jgi:hypothetical protein
VFLCVAKEGSRAVPFPFPMLVRSIHEMARMRGETSLDAAMRAPSTQAPDVVVLDFVNEEKVVREDADPKKDLWLSTADG